jgi:hypothetical protein
MPITGAEMTQSGKWVVSRLTADTTLTHPTTGLVKSGWWEIRKPIGPQSIQGQDPVVYPLGTYAVTLMQPQFIVGNAPLWARGRIVVMVTVKNRPTSDAETALARVYLDLHGVSGTTANGSEIRADYVDSITPIFRQAEGATDFYYTLGHIYEVELT